MCSVTILTKSGIEIQKVTKCEFAITLEYQKYYSISDFGQTNLHIIAQDEPKLIYPAD